LAGKGRDSNAIAMAMDRALAIDTEMAIAIDRNRDRDSAIHSPSHQGAAGPRRAGIAVGAGVAVARGSGGFPANGSGRAGAARSGGALVVLLLLLPLAGCGPRPPFPVQTLADSGFEPLPAEQLDACAAKLRLPPELPRPADATNFGVRQRRDAFGREVPHKPQLIVLHETVISAADTARRFATPHPKDDDQASYHVLVDREGQRLRIVPDGGRAFGAAMAAFGDFTVRIRPTSVGSLNNVALHLSLESPPDGRGDGDAHSGYTKEQYRAAAGQVLLWQAAFGIPISRLTTHEAVDRSHSRRDPRSFSWNSFDAAWRDAAQRCGLTAYDRGRATI
jgi:N-acetyl-anhydromuramyl-L-alanine amidase AmpD